VLSWCGQEHLYFTSVLCSRLCLGFRSCLFLSCFPTKTLYALILSPIHVTRPTHHVLLDFVTLITSGGEYKSESYSGFGFLEPSVTSFLLGPSIFLSTLLLNAFSLCSSLNMGNHISHPCNTTDTITAYCILYYIFHI